MIIRDISREQHIGCSGTTPIARLSLFCDTSDELAEVTAVNGITAAQGSIALAVREGEILVLDSEGTWYKQSSGTAVTPAEDDEQAEAE